MKPKPFKKKYFSGFFALLLLCCLTHQNTRAQDFAPRSISIGYFGPIPFEPGLRLGINFLFKSFDNSALILNMHVGVFNKKNDNFNVLAGAELGWKLQPEGSKNLNVFSLGAGYLFQNEVTEFSVNLQGDITATKRTPRHIFMPTINYEYGRVMNERLTPFFKLSYGHRMASTIANSGSFMWEIGSRISLNNE